MRKRGKEGKKGKHQLMFKNHPATYISCSFLNTASQVVLKLETVQQLPRGDTQTPLYLKNAALDRWKQAIPYGYINFYL